MNRGPTNNTLWRLSIGLEKIGKKNKAPIWQRVAELLVKSTRSRVEINLYKLEKYAQGAVVVVPGKVLSIGKLTKPVTVACLTASVAATKKIEKAGGKVLTLEKLAEQNPTGKGLRILI